MRQLTTMDANRNVAELGGVVSDHLSSTLLVELLTRHLRWWHVGQESESAVLTGIHPSITVGMVANIVLHKFQLI